MIYSYLPLLYFEVQYHNLPLLLEEYEHGVDYHPQTPLLVHLHVYTFFSFVFYIKKNQSIAFYPTYIVVLHVLMPQFLYSMTAFFVIFTALDDKPTPFGYQLVSLSLYMLLNA